MIAELSPHINKLFDEFEELLPVMKDFGVSVLDMVRPLAGFVFSKEVGGLVKDVGEIATSARHMSRSLLWICLYWGLRVLTIY